MADAPKRKRLEKTQPPPQPIGNQRFVCCRCGTAFSRQKGYFPVSHSPMYRSSGYLPWCNDCIESMYDGYRRDLQDDRAAMKRMCMKMDLYWSDAIYEMVERTAGVNSRIRNYIGKTNMIRYIDKTFDDTLREDSEADKIAAANNDQLQAGYLPEDESAEIEIPEDVKLFWGPGYTPGMYLELEERRKYWMSQYPDEYKTDAGEDAIIRQICNVEIDINHDRAAGKDPDKKINTLNNLIGSMNLRPAQRKTDERDAALEKMPLGVGIQKWEYYRPLPETPADRKDVHGLIRNVTTWFLGHACKMVGLHNSYCKMYEDEMNRLRVSHPEYDEEDDDTVLSELFGKKPGGDA